MIQVAIEKYKKVQDLNWNETENNPEKESKLKAFHETKKWKYFELCVSAYCCRIHCHSPHSNIDPNSGKELSFENLISADIYDDGSGQEKIWDFKEEPFDTELRDNIFIEDSSNGTVIGNFFLSDPNTAGQRAELAIAPWSWNDHYTYPTLYWCTTRWFCLLDHHSPGGCSDGGETSIVFDSNDLLVINRQSEMTFSLFIYWTLLLWTPMILRY